MPARPPERRGGRASAPEGATGCRGTIPMLRSAPLAGRSPACSRRCARTLRIPLLVLTALAVLVLAACGSSGGGTSADTKKLLDDTFGSAKPVDSGRLKLGIDVRAPGVAGLPSPLTVRLGGPFERTSAKSTPKFDFDVTLATKDGRFTIGIVSTGHVRLGEARDAGVRASRGPVLEARPAGLRARRAGRPATSAPSASTRAAGSRTSRTRASRRSTARRSCTSAPTSISTVSQGPRQAPVEHGRHRPERDRRPARGHRRRRAGRASPRPSAARAWTSGPASRTTSCAGSRSSSTSTRPTKKDGTVALDLAVSGLNEPQDDLRRPTTRARSRSSPRRSAVLGQQRAQQATGGGAPSTPARRIRADLRRVRHGRRRRPRQGAGVRRAARLSPARVRPTAAHILWRPCPLRFPRSAVRSRSCARPTAGRTSSSRSSRSRSRSRSPHAGPVVLFATSALGRHPDGRADGPRDRGARRRAAGPGIGGLLNVTFGNAPELIIALFALQQGLQEVVKASIVGSIIGNILLVLGASMYFGGLGPRPPALQRDGRQRAVVDAPAGDRGGRHAGGLRARRRAGPAVAERRARELRLDRRAALARSPRSCSSARTSRASSSRCAPTATSSTRRPRPSTRRSPGACARPSGCSRSPASRSPSCRRSSSARSPRPRRRRASASSSSARSSSRSSATPPSTGSRCSSRARTRWTSP